MLGNVLSVNKLVSKAVEFSDANETNKMMYVLGQITYVMLDFEPIVLDEAGFGRNIGLDGEIYLQDKPPVNKSLEGARDIVSKWHQEVEDHIMGRKDELEYEFDGSRPIVK